MIDYIFAILILALIGFVLWATEDGNNFVQNIMNKVRKVILNDGKRDSDIKENKHIKKTKI